MATILDSTAQRPSGVKVGSITGPGELFVVVVVAQKEIK